MKNLLVIIDNGHGNNTPGKCSPDKSLYEWKWCREVAHMLYNELTKAGISASLVVTEDTDIPLSTRVKRINSLYDSAKKSGKEAVMISIHINAAGADGKWHTASGWSCWIAENASDKSKLLAKLLYEEASSCGLKGNRSVPREKYWVSNFYITKNSKCPAVLTENMFQDNKDDAKFLLSDKGKKIITEVHKNAILAYARSI